MTCIDHQGGMRGTWPALAAGGRAWNMAGICCGRMVEQVSRGARPRRGTSCCHRGEPLEVTENSLLPCTTVPPSACIHYRRWPHSHLLPALSDRGQGQALAAGASRDSWPQSPLRAFPPPPAFEGRLGPAAASRTHCWRQPHLHPLLVPEPLLAPTAGPGPACSHSQQQSCSSQSVLVHGAGPDRSAPSAGKSSGCQPRSP
uniref:Uncharacterized protein n=1 Tax=Myotis myotis TaxID=51298 RepID=A0A7J7ZY19_MYOMY|nr:hypothetical protein mMyoMyo1_009822 [Myotis myotis]